MRHAKTDPGSLVPAVASGQFGGTTLDVADTEFLNPSPDKKPQNKA